MKDGRVFIGDRRGSFYCLDATTGNGLWRRQTSRGCNNQVNATAAAAGHTVITANNEGYVVCYAAPSGKTIWRQRLDGACIGELLRFRTSLFASAMSLFAIDCKAGMILKKFGFPGKRVSSLTLAGSRIAFVLGTDFHSQPSAWDDPAAFNGELVVLQGYREIVRQGLSGTPYIRACDQTGLVFTATHSILNVLDPSDGSRVLSRRGELSLPSFSDGVLYGLAGNGVVFAEPTSLPH